jgi:O-antigen/teichoic acid export membrane protein
MPVFLVALGTVGIVAATGAGYVVAVIASIVFMRRRLKFRFDLKTRGTRLRATARYSATSYASALLNLLPTLVLPYIVLRDLGPQDEAYFFMAYQISTLLSAASFAISEALFSEGAHDPANIAKLLRRSAKIMAIIVVPSALIVAAGSGLILDIFGSEYAQHAHGLLVLLCLGSIAVAFNSWASSALRVLVRMRALVISNVVMTVGVLGLAAAFGSRGLLWVGYAWVIGNFLSGLAAAVRIPLHAFNPAKAAQVAPSIPETLEPSGFMDMPTEPMFFPWNRPEAIRFNTRPQPKINAATLGSAPEDDVERTMNLRLHLGGMRLRPRTDSDPDPVAGKVASRDSAALQGEVVPKQ